MPRTVEHHPRAWARLRVDINCALRRGAWYLQRRRAVRSGRSHRRAAASRLVDSDAHACGERDEVSPVVQLFLYAIRCDVPLGGFEQAREPKET